MRKDSLHCATEAEPALIWGFWQCFSQPSSVCSSQCTERSEECESIARDSAARQAHEARHRVFAILHIDVQVYSLTANISRYVHSSHSSHASALPHIQPVPVESPPIKLRTVKLPQHVSTHNVYVYLYARPCDIQSDTVQEDNGHVVLWRRRKRSGF